MPKILKIRVVKAEDYAKRGFWTVGTFHRAAVPVKKDQDVQSPEPPAAEAGDADDKADNFG